MTPLKFNPRRLTGLTLLIIFAALAVSCSRQPRDHWWQFWRRTPGEFTDHEIVLAPPDTPSPEEIYGSEFLEGSLDPALLALDPDLELPEPEPIRQDVEGIIVDLATIYFDFDSFALTDASRAAVEANADWIRSHPGVSIRIEGHCDDRGTEEYNYNLGLKRAQAVREQLVSLRLDPDLLHTFTWGETRPIELGGDESAYRLNRRVQFAAWSTD
jgi:outer membrane protein OmpA-like peptidoglycan-associated protein